MLFLFVTTTDAIGSLGFTKITLPHWPPWDASMSSLIQKRSGRTSVVSVGLLHAESVDIEVLQNSVKVSYLFLVILSIFVLSSVRAGSK